MAEERTEYQNITIKTVDQAVYDWFDKTVDAFAEFPDEPSRKVPVVFAAGERWTNARDPRSLRDKNGVLILPIISVRRTNIDRDRNVAIALGTKTDRLTIAKRLDEKTAVVQNALFNRNVPRRARIGKVIYEVTTIPFPDWFTTGYEIEIQAQYISQMNAIIEKIFFRLDNQNSFVMPITLSEFKSDARSTPSEEREVLPNYYFVGFMDTDMSDAGNFDEFTDSERIVKYSFNLTVPTYVQLDPDGVRPAIQKKYTTYDISFPDECVRFVDNMDDMDLIFRIRKPGN